MKIKFKFSIILNRSLGLIPKLEPKTQYHQSSQKSENSKEMKRKLS